MYLIIVGMDSVGRSLVDLAVKDKHEVVVIEEQEYQAQAILQKYDVRVLQADIAQAGIMDEAGADQADALIATTHSDTGNLMTMFLGREHKINTLISVVNEPEHQGLFERLGVQVLIDPELIIARYLYKLLHQDDA